MRPSFYALSVALKQIVLASGHIFELKNRAGAVNEPGAGHRLDEAIRKSEVVINTFCLSATQSIADKRDQ